MKPSSIDLNADDDGDGLKNGWELYGYDANSDGIIDVNLPALGANYRHKDIFVEMDWMVNDVGTDYSPTAAELSRIVAVFANAPVSNPDGTTGINIHLDKSNQVPYQYNLDLTSGWAAFDAIKSANFDSKRQAVYHYMVFANRYNSGTSSGISRGIPASNFLVTLGGWSTRGGTSDQRVGTFIHELGHNLGLTHGGGGPTDHVNYKPNYLSVMNYTWQTVGLYYGSSFGDFDYQRFTLPALNEAGLNESVGLNSTNANGYGTAQVCSNTLYLVHVANGPIDWNCNSTFDGGTVSYDINGDLNINTLLATQNNWTSLVYTGGGIIGSGLSPEELLKRLPQSVPEWDSCLTDDALLPIVQQPVNKKAP